MARMIGMFGGGGMPRIVMPGPDNYGMSVEEYTRKRSAVNNYRRRRKPGMPVFRNDQERPLFQHDPLRPAMSSRGYFGPKGYMQYGY